MTEIYWDFYISFAAASLSDVVKNPVHNGAKSIMKSYLYIYYSLYTQRLSPQITVVAFQPVQLAQASFLQKN